MSNNLRRMAVLKKYELLTKASLLRNLLEKKRGALHAPEDLKPLFKIFFTFVCKKIRRKITDKYISKI